jgi:chromosome segregation ATPase
MLVALGFLAASLLGLLVASAFWSRAVRLTTARIKQSMPVSEPEIKADRDRLRAEYAIKVHKLEMQLDQAKLARARQMIDLNRRDASISTLETDVVQLKADLEENQNARRVLEQTVADRLPRVEARLNEAKRLLFNRDREIAELTAGAKRQRSALEEASSINAQQNAQIEQLSRTLTTRGGRGRQGAADGGSEGEVALRAEIESLRAKAREQAILIDRLQRRHGPGYALAPPSGAGASEGDITRAQRDISEAEAALQSVRGGASDGDMAAAASAYEREIRALKAGAQDQAGEIARLKAALAAFEQQDRTGGLKDSKIALKARLGSAQAQADQQAATIAKLRAELAAAHERLARQAAHFMGEMRRIGTGGTAPPAAAQARQAARGSGRTLAERVAQVRTGSATSRTEGDTAASRAGESRRAELAIANGRNGRVQSEAKPAAQGREDAAAAAAQLPKAPEIPERRRRPTLIDRITGLGKG